MATTLDAARCARMRSPWARVRCLQRDHGLAKRLALGGIDHRDIARKAERRREHVAAAAPVLARGAILRDVMEQRAELAQLDARNRRTLVDDDAGHFLAPAAANDAHLLGMDLEAFGGDDLA